MKKELYRSKNRIAFGICGGLAEYFEVDVTVLRLVFLFTLIFTGFFPFGLFYLLATIIVPEKPLVHNVENTTEEKKS